MDKVREIPSALMLQWEQEAMEQKVSLHGLKDFIRMKERLYWQSVEEKKERPQIFANSARNKLTEYGNSYVLDYFLQIPIVERTCKLARFDMEDLQKKLSNGFVSEEQKENFLFHVAPSLEQNLFTGSFIARTTDILRLHCQLNIKTTAGWRSFFFRL